MLAYKLSAFWLIRSAKEEESAMKILSKQTLKRIQFSKWGKKVVHSPAAVSARRKAPLSCWTRYVLKQLVWKVKAQCRQALRWQRSSMQFSYDFHSYSLNFDDDMSNRRTRTISC
ncbi:hypothetical protein SLE2022_208930 [Rubroshorea leprosula]